MTCFMCKGSMKDKLTTFMVEVDSSIIIVKNVPSQVCSQCGEVTYNNDVAMQLEKIVARSRELITEIAVVNYSDRVA